MRQIIGSLWRAGQKATRYLAIDPDLQCFPIFCLTETDRFTEIKQIILAEGQVIDGAYKHALYAIHPHGRFIAACDVAHARKVASRQDQSRHAWSARPVVACRGA